MAFLFRLDALDSVDDLPVGWSENNTPLYDQGDNPAGRSSYGNDGGLNWIETTWDSAYLDGTMSVWYKGTDVGATDSYHNGGKHVMSAATSSSNKYGGVMLDTAGKPRFWWGATAVYVNGSVAVNDNAWHMLTMVIDSSALTFEAFVDGVSIGTSGVFLQGSGAPPLRVGGAGRGQTHGPDGIFADPLFNDTKYTDEQIVSLFEESTLGGGVSQVPLIRAPRYARARGRNFAL